MYFVIIELWSKKVETYLEKVCWIYSHVGTLIPFCDGALKQMYWRGICNRESENTIKYFTQRVIFENNLSKLHQPLG